MIFWTSRIAEPRTIPRETPAARLACMQKTIHKRTIDIGIISLVTNGLATAIPPTALVTETAGVKTPSAIVNLAYTQFDVNWI